MSRSTADDSNAEEAVWFVGRSSGVASREMMTPHEHMWKNFSAKRKKKETNKTSKEQDTWLPPGPKQLSSLTDCTFVWIKELPEALRWLCSLAVSLFGDARKELSLRIEAARKSVVVDCGSAMSSVCPVDS